MKKIVPFRKEIIFKTNISEITSISLEHTLKLEEYSVDGEFIISGEYKMADISTNTENFNFNLPFNITIDDKYLVDKVVVDIDDFYYEVINEKTLVVNIDVLINNLEEKDIKEIEVENKNEKVDYQEIEERKCEYTEDIEELKDDFFEKKEFFENEILEKTEEPLKMEDTTKKVMKEETDIFSSFEDNDTFSTYKVYIVREGDIIEGIMEKYGITRELLEKYNDLSEIKIGDKLIIPSEWKK